MWASLWSDIMIYVFLANGFEEIEALAVVDVLRRAELDVLTVGVGEDFVIGSHQIPVAADISEKVYSYCFNLYDDNILIASSGEQIHNNSKDNYQ